MPYITYVNGIENQTFHTINKILFAIVNRNKATS